MINVNINININNNKQKSYGNTLISVCKFHTTVPHFIQKITNEKEL